MRNYRRISLLRLIGVLVVYLAVVSLALRVMPGVWINEGRLLLTAVVILLEILAVGFVMLTFYIIATWLFKRESKVLDGIIIVFSIFFGIVLADWLIDGFIANLLARILLTVIILGLVCVMSARKR